MTDPVASLVTTIQSKTNVVLATHINPDADALGSLLGLADILEHMGKKVVRYLEEPVAPHYRFFAGCGKVETDIDKVRDFVSNAADDIMAIALDCGDKERLGKSGPGLMKIRPFMVIDHHRGNKGFGDISWVEAHCSSTGEMIYSLARALGANISFKAAECLYAAISSDTGSFKYESTGSSTFSVAKELVQLGVRPEVISSNLYDNYTLGRLRLMQEVLASLEIHGKDKVAVIRVSQGMLERTYTTMLDTEHFINLPRSIRSIDVVVFLKQVTEDSVSVSLRAKGNCDVSLVAAKFGGGGHRNAAGFRMHGKSMDEVRDTLLPVLQVEFD